MPPTQPPPVPNSSVLSLVSTNGLEFGGHKTKTSDYADGNGRLIFQKWWYKKEYSDGVHQDTTLILEIDDWGSNTEYWFGGGDLDMIAEGASIQLVENNKKKSISVVLDKKSLSTALLSGSTHHIYAQVALPKKSIDNLSGTFFTSDFETIINDSTGIPYFIDMVVDHEDYGTVTSSVFNPGDNSDTNINGIFAQS